ncbi:MAG: hypothetical protein NT062_38275, partial [Proteobacteria bacterium]|nr:hypothetical protein [Pseudomonadota bacterium]
MNRTIGLTLLASVGVVTTAHANPAAEKPLAGLAVGVELGEPTAATVAYTVGTVTIGAAIGTGTLAGAGLSMHADATFEVMRLSPKMPLVVGLGMRHYRHGYEAMSIDEMPDAHTGARATIGVAIDRRPLQLFAELSPGVDVFTSQSCTFASGARSICPHAQENPFFIQFAVGA